MLIFCGFEFRIFYLHVSAQYNVFTKPNYFGQAEGQSKSSAFLTLGRWNDSDLHMGETSSTTGGFEPRVVN